MTPSPVARPAPKPYFRELGDGSASLLRELTVDVEGTRLAFDTAWLRRRFREGRSILRDAAQAHNHTTLILAGNGPSLSTTNWSLLDGQHLMVSNYAHLCPAMMNYARFWCIVNPVVAAQMQVSLADYPEVIKLMPFWLSAWIEPDDRTVLVRASGDPSFSRSVGAPVSIRSTVSYFAMQIAYQLGYRRIMLIGFDHDYRQPPDAQEGELLRESPVDTNHFDPSYFADKYWQAADTHSMDYVYALARCAFDTAGGEIVNCSTQSRLRIFRRGTLTTELARGSSSREEPSWKAKVQQRTLALIDWLRSRNGSLALIGCASLFVALALASNSIPSVPTRIGAIAAAAIGTATLLLQGYARAAAEKAQHEQAMKIDSLLRRADRMDRQDTQ